MSAWNSAQRRQKSGVRQTRRDAFGGLYIDLAFDSGVEYERLAGELTYRFGYDIDVSIDEVQRNRSGGYLSMRDVDQQRNAKRCDKGPQGRKKRGARRVHRRSLASPYVSEACSVRAGCGSKSARVQAEPLYLLVVLFFYVFGDFGTVKANHTTAGCAASVAFVLTWPHCRKTRANAT